MKILMRVSALVMLLALMLCAAGCKKETAAPQPGTQAPAQSGDALPSAEDTADGNAEDGTAAPSGEAAVENTATPSGETATENTAAPSDNTDTSAPADQEQPSAGQETDVEFNETVETWEDEELWMDEIGIGPRITVKWETYEAMSAAEQEAYRACFTTQFAFEEWEQMAMMDYESSMNEDMFLGTGSLNLKEIIESLVGETLG